MEGNAIFVIYTSQKRRFQSKATALFSSALFACSLAANAQNATRQKLSPSFQALLQRQSAPLSAHFNFAAPAIHKVRVTDATPPNDPFVNSLNGQSPLQWAPAQTQTIQAWHLWQPKNSKPIVIAIVDTGVDDKHPDLTSMILRDAAGNVIGCNTLTVPFTLGPTTPDHPHGTHCAGIAAAQSNNGIGVAGMAGWSGGPNFSDTSHVKIMPVKVLDANGEGTDQNVADGIDWAVAHGANIISLSLGDVMPSDPIAQSIANAWSAGLLIVCAAGNEGSTNYFYPAASPHAVSVSATSPPDPTQPADARPWWSNFGLWVNLAAPGVNIYSTFPNNNYTYLSGTSMACPCVAGLAALVWAQNPTLKNSDVYSVIRRSVDPYPANNDPIETGSGRINSYTTLTAVNAAMGTVNGSVTLEGCVNANQTVSARFHSVDGALDFTYSAMLTAAAGADTGVFTLSNIPAATYTVSVKGEKWLKRNVTVTASNAPAAALSVRLLAGDANNDNLCDATDFGLLVGAYGSDASIPGSGYDETADFNCDGLVDTSDFGLLVGNYGRQGDD